MLKKGKKQTRPKYRHLNEKNFKMLPYVSAVSKSLCLCVIQNQN